MDKLVALGAICKLYRKNRYIKQRDIAKIMGKSPETISAFETGRSPNVRMLLFYFEHIIPQKDWETVIWRAIHNDY